MNKIILDKIITEQNIKDALYKYGRRNAQTPQARGFTTLPEGIFFTITNPSSIRNSINGLAEALRDLDVTIEPYQIHTGTGNSIDRAGSFTTEMSFVVKRLHGKQPR